MNNLLEKHNFQSLEEARDFCKTFWSSSPSPKPPTLVEEVVSTIRGVLVPVAVAVDTVVKEKQKEKKKKKKEPHSTITQAAADVAAQRNAVINDALDAQEQQKDCAVAVDVEDTKEKKVKKKKSENGDNQKDKSGNEWQRIIPIKIPKVFAGTKLEKKKKIWDYILSNQDSINNPDYDSIIKGRLRGTKSETNMGIDKFNDLHKTSYEQNKVGETIEKAHLNQERDVAGFTDQIREHVTEEVRPYRIGTYNGNTYVIGFIPV